MARKYYTLIDRQIGGKWAPQFGDYDRSVVADELLYHKDTAEYDDAGIIEWKILATKDDRQETINAAIAALNEKINVTE